jgi:glycosyltransferase involved in cell wall biosynthesis
MKVVVLTTSYPRDEGDAAGRFVADAVEQLRQREIEIEVVSPNDFRHYGIARGSGVLGNLRRDPWRLFLSPLMLASFRRAARRAAADADLIHAHWLPVGGVAMGLRTPYVLQVWGTDIELGRRLPALARPILRRARLVIAASNALAEEAAALGAREVRMIPSGVDVPGDVSDPADPPEVLYAGRLSAEKGIRELVAATAGMKLVVAGDGPLRNEVPGALGFVPHDELRALYARASVVVCPSHREGFGVVCAEAMAHGRPVVAGAVGGLLDLVVDGQTGLLVPPRDAAALRSALERLLADGALRRRMGAAGRDRARRFLSWNAVTDATIAAYREALA